MDSCLNIVVVEDHNRLRAVTVHMLQAEGYQVQGLSCAEEVEDVLSNWIPDLFVIDVGLPGEDGLSLAQRLRACHSGVGIIMVTARSDLRDRLQGYQSGADIYLPKPVDLAELLAAITALGRRVKAVTPLGLHATSVKAPGKPAGAPMPGELLLHPQSLTLEGTVGTQGLTQSECILVAALARAPSQTLEHWQVARNLGQSEDALSKSSVEVRVARLRKKLSQTSGHPHPIKAIRTQGYKLCVSVRVT